MSAYEVLDKLQIARGSFGGLQAALPCCAARQPPWDRFPAGTAFCVWRAPSKTPTLVDCCFYSIPEVFGVLGGEHATRRGGPRTPAVQTSCALLQLIKPPCMQTSTLPRQLAGSTAGQKCLQLAERARFVVAFPV